MESRETKQHLLKWIKLVKRCNEDEVFKKTVVELCKKDILFFINTFVFTYDPRTDLKKLPLILYPFQERAVLKIEEKFRVKQPLLVEKSRDMGFSWFTLAWIIHHFLFDPGFSAGIGSYKADLVDELGNMKSLMQRCRFILNNLPDFLLQGWSEEKNSKYMSLVHPTLHTSITGESGDNIGRGNRTSVYLLDEFAFIPRSSAVHAAVSQTTDCLIFGSTPNGKGNEFARLRFKGKEGKTQLAHTLNGSALALPRIVASLLENNQTDDGIALPKVLHTYFGSNVIS